MFKVVIFDLDNTLYDYTYAHSNAINSVIKYIQFQYNCNNAFEIYNKYEHKA